MENGRGGFQAKEKSFVSGDIAFSKGGSIL